MSNMLCMIVDGMDQAKFKSPRVKERYSKLFAKLFKPTLHVAASWIHGQLLTFFVGEADVKKDSNSQLEIISRSLSQMYNEIKSLPAGFELQQDNCYREGKNQYVMAYLLLLVILEVFRWTVAGYLRPGHSSRLSFASRLS
jgi:hypothetical protein